MRRISKFKVQRLGPFEVPMASGARVIAVGVEPGDSRVAFGADQPVMWAIVDPDAAKQARKFVTVRDGEDVANHLDRFEYVGTFQLGYGGYVGHVFEVA